ncbi:MAG: DMT family transporter [Rhizobiaceae bacterium]|nr:DMT family transporter [Rhizobiaceae bacterium]
MTNTNLPDNNNSSLAWIALAITPMFFSTNIIFGRAANAIDPFTLATLRWSISALVLFIIIRSQWPLARRLITDHWKLLLLCGFLAMWLCGGLVYLALKYTTATNGTLIYTTPPLMIILIERFTRGRKISLRELLGIVLAMTGIVAIITEGNFYALLELEFNRGDLMFLLAAVSWAFYSITLKKKVFSDVPVLPLFCVIALFGSLTLLPFAVAEIIYSGNYPTTITDWQMVAGIVVFSSLIPFTLYQFGNRIHGPTSASVFMYLLPPFGLGLAWLFLDEVPNMVTLFGCVLVLGGVILATLPVNKLLFSKSTASKL